jgi:hypothetical protein
MLQVISAPCSNIQGLKKKKDFGDGLSLGSDVYMKWK